MRRRDFLKKATVVVGLAASPEMIAPLTAGESSSQKPSRVSGPSADYLRRVQADKFLPKPPAFAGSYQSPAVQISPMSLAGEKDSENTYEAWTAKSAGLGRTGDPVMIMQCKKTARP
jgi:hypothetical protein